MGVQCECESGHKYSKWLRTKKENMKQHTLQRVKRNGWRFKRFNQ